LQLVAGRNLQPGDTTREYLVNESFVKKLNLASPEDILNKQISIGQEKAMVVGVIRDFHNWSLSEPIAPIAISTRSDGYETCAVQLDPGNPAPVLAQIRQAWEQQFPDNFFESSFMDEQIKAQLETETMIMRLVNTFAGIAIFIGCLGLYGLAAFLVAQKRKEVGIRKTLGASVSGILWLFGKEYARLIFIAFVLAAPLAWWTMDRWLQDYAYRISVGAGIFVVSLLTTFGVAAMTVGFQSVRAALADPVKSLRSE
jgi:ABC-type antimicrobial peptide transport system permease subunit